MAEKKNPAHDLFAPHPDDAPDATPDSGVDNSADQPDREGNVEGVDQDVGDSVGTPRVTDGGIETAPLTVKQR